MSQKYDKWTTMINPPVGVFTNSYVNYHEGVTTVITLPTGIHTLPNSFKGKKFHINNDRTSTHSFSVQVETQNGLEQFDIKTGDSAIFVYTGNGLWDQTGGEQVITQIANTIAGGSIISQQNQFNRTILFSDSPDSGVATYDLGVIPSGFSVSDISINTNVVFNDNTCDEITIQSAIGPTTIMGPLQSDIKTLGNFTTSYPSASAPLGGLIQAVFNSPLANDGGNQGSLTILVEYQSV